MSLSSSKFLWFAPKDAPLVVVWYAALTPSYCLSVDSNDLTGNNQETDDTDVAASCHSYSQSYTDNVEDLVLAFYPAAQTRKRLANRFLASLQANVARFSRIYNVMQSDFALYASVHAYCTLGGVHSLLITLQLFYLHFVIFVCILSMCVVLLFRPLYCFHFRHLYLFCNCCF